MSKNGYINATKLCKIGGKRFDHWAQNVASIHLIEDFEKELFPTKNDTILIKIVTGPNEYRGTYVHNILIPHIASWISTKFALV